jgi:hypothetical protein
MRSAPQNRLFAAISLIKLIASGEILGFLERTFDLCFQNSQKSSRCQREPRLRLDKEERFFPGSNHAGQEHQKKPVRLSVHRAFDLSTQDEQLVTK